jgi:hypothetical protein
MPPVEELVSRYLDRVDAELPGLVEGFYLVGSVALGNYRPGTSDVDFVAVTADPLGPRELATLARIRRPHLDGSYRTWADLAGPAEKAGDTPVTWHTLARYGIAVRGPDPSTVDIHLDPAALSAWCRGNLDGYWRSWLARSGRLASRAGLVALSPWATVWVVTGVSRIHHTIATGEIISKEAAARYALATFPSRWHRVAGEALRIRRAEPGAGYRTPLARRRDVLAFGRMVVADAA